MKKINPLWSRYNWIRQVCCNPSHPEYHKYGALGIVCDWPRPYSHEEFYSWINSTLGPRPEGYVLGRKDKAGDFVKHNLEWQTPKHRTRTAFNISHQIAYKGEIRPLMEWSEMLAIPQRYIREKLALNMNLEQIVEKYQQYHARRRSTP
jgi:hypothetical protein